MSQGQKSANCFIEKHYNVKSIIQTSVKYCLNNTEYIRNRVTRQQRIGIHQYEVLNESNSEVVVACDNYMLINTNNKNK